MSSTGLLSRRSVGLNLWGLSATTVGLQVTPAQHSELRVK